MCALSITNSQASLHDSFVSDLAAWLAQELDVPVRFVDEGTWDEREARLDAGEIDLGWICGAPYLFKRAHGIPLEVLAAPVMSAPRYGARPVYFSDIIVRAGSPYFAFDDLRGARWAYNEPQSYSGYHAVRHYLATRALDGGFFGEAVASGAHARSVEMVLQNRAEASAIDSTVLEMLYASAPTLAQRLRVIETLGPGTMPPFVAGLHLAADLRAQIRQAMTQLHLTHTGRALLGNAHMLKLARVSDSDYDTMRQRLELARDIQL